MSDIEIARAAKKKPIFEIGESLNIPAADLVPFGHDKAKISQNFINSVQDRPNGKLILVTAINPTPAGEGKTTTTVGLGDGLEPDWQESDDLHSRGIFGAEFRHEGWCRWWWLCADCADGRYEFALYW